MYTQDNRQDYDYAKTFIILWNRATNQPKGILRFLTLLKEADYLIAPTACMNVLVLVREEGTPEAVDFSLFKEVRR